MVDSEHQASPPTDAMVCAFNEEGRVGQVVRVLGEIANESLIKSTLVVVNNCTDGTADEVRGIMRKDSSIRMIDYSDPDWRGKDNAMLIGLSALLDDNWNDRRPGSLLMLDADLTNLTPDHVHAMFEKFQEYDGEKLVVHPVHNGILRGHGQGGITGQRLCSVDRLLDTSMAGANGWGTEIKLTIDALLDGQLAVADYEVLRHALKMQKRGAVTGVWQDACMHSKVGAAAFRHLADRVRRTSGDTIRDFVSNPPERVRALIGLAIEKPLKYDVQ